jgi:hypothetical protein
MAAVTIRNRAYDSPISADTLRRKLRIGAARSRLLVALSVLVRNR